jgi:hypothetical protein
MTLRSAALRTLGGIGAVVGYGGLAAFLYLISVQIYRWFRDGEWTHVGINDGMRIGLQHCCVKEGAAGRISSFLQWLDSPLDWHGLHRVFEVVPASLALFVISIAGNSLFIYCRDRLDKR